MFTTNAYHIKLEGDSYTVGRTLGTMVLNKPGLASMLILPEPAFSPREEEKIIGMFHKFCPGINEEIAGFCDVLKVPVGRALYYGQSFLKPGCSQMALLSSKTDNGHIYLARNYDFSEKLEDLMLCTTKITGKHGHISSANNLFGRGDGLNECGLAVSMTSAGLPVSNMEGWLKKPAIEGLSFWPVIRSVLENCADVEEAVRFTKEIPIAFNINLMVVDKKNKAALIETYDGRFAVKTIHQDTPEQYLCSTNHVCLPELSHFEEHKLKNSIIRYDLINQMLAGKEQVSAVDIKKLLSTQYPAGLCLDYYDEFLGTLRSIIFDVTSGEANLCFGSPDINPWHQYRITDSIERNPIPVYLRKQVMGEALVEMV